jgi:hypothetical protein
MQFLTPQLRRKEWYRNYWLVIHVIMVLETANYLMIQRLGGCFVQTPASIRAGALTLNENNKRLCHNGIALKGLRPVLQWCLQPVLQRGL